MPLDAAIGRVFAPYRPGGRHGHQFWRKNWVVALWNHFSKLAFKRHDTDPLISSLKQQEQLKPKSTAYFLAIKRYQRTKNVEVTNPQRSLSKNWRSSPSIAAKLLITSTIFVSSHRLIASNVCKLYSSNRGISHLHEACCIDELSRGSFLGLKFSQTTSARNVP